jgi:hypothetical protein
MWGCNQAVDTVVTRKSPDGDADADSGGATDTGVKMGLQVAVKWKEKDRKKNSAEDLSSDGHPKIGEGGGCWSLPGKFITSLGADKRPLLTLLSAVTHNRAELVLFFRVPSAFCHSARSIAGLEMLHVKKMCTA